MDDLQGYCFKWAFIYIFNTFDHLIYQVLAMEIL